MNLHLKIIFIFLGQFYIPDLTHSHKSFLSWKKRTCCLNCATGTCYREWHFL